MRHPPRPNRLECTYSHFETSSQCPSCGSSLTENDFTELVVADATSATTEVMKISMQALFTKKSSSSSLPFSDLCYSLIRQIDAVKLSTKFLLKQLLMDASAQGRQSGNTARAYEAMKHENTQLKQSLSTQKLEFQQLNANMQNRLQAREATVAELQHKIQSQEKLLHQFRQMHNGTTIVPGSSNSAPSSRLGMDHSIDQGQTMNSGSHQKPPLKGFMMQKEARERAQHEAIHAQRAPSVLGRSMPNQPMKRSNSFGTERMPHSHGHHANITPIQLGSRPFSSKSEGSGPGTPRIRDLSTSAGYRFTSSSGTWQGSQHINKKRRGTPSSIGGSPSVHQGMSPNTAFALNNGHYSGRGPTQYFHQG